MGLIRDHLRLYLVTDIGLCAEQGLVAVVTAAVRGGVTCVQLRDKAGSTPDRIAAARALKQALAGSGVPLIINDDIDAAYEAEVDGVHLGQDDAKVTEARARLGPDRTIGVSCDTVDQVRVTDPCVVDYLGLGTVFPTASKSDHKPSIGLCGLAELADAAVLPSVAIGGLKEEHAARVLAAGCEGMAVVSAICGQRDPERAARALRHALDRAKGAVR